MCQGVRKKILNGGVPKNSKKFCSPKIWLISRFLLYYKVPKTRGVLGQPGPEHLAEHPTSESDPLAKVRELGHCCCLKTSLKKKCKLEIQINYGFLKDTDFLGTYINILKQACYDFKKIVWRNNLFLNILAHITSLKTFQSASAD